MSSTPMVAALVASPYPHRGFEARRAGHGTQPAYCRRIPVAAGWRGGAHWAKIMKNIQ